MKKPYVLLIPCLLFTGCATNDHLTLKENERTFEYGEAVSADPADYLKETDKAILDAVEVSVEQEGTLIEEQELRSTDEKGNPLDVLNVGEYDLHLRYEEEEETVHLVITDTTAPEWVDFPKTLRLEKGSEKEELREHFQCKDLSKCSISIEGDYDLSKAGNYTITVIAKDASDNQISKECKLTVYEPKKTSSGGSAQSGNSGSSNTANQTPSTGNSSGGSSGQSGSSGGSSKPSTPQEPETPAASYHTAYARQVADLVNEQRASAGLDRLAWDPSLSSAANIRSKELTVLFSHTRPDGTDCFTAISNPQDYVAFGENIAAGQPSPSVVMDAWMNSSGHRANILNSHYTKIGVSCYDKDDMYHWVQIFGG